jgi:hypothetical protein
VRGRVREGVNDRLKRDHRTDGAVAQKRGPHSGSGGAEVSRKAESAQHQAEPVSEFVGNPIEQECLWAEPQSPLPAGPQQQSIEYQRGSHWGLQFVYGNAFSRAIHSYLADRAVAFPADSSPPLLGEGVRAA